MGIRIHKQLGYGLVDVQTKDRDALDDPRINADSPALCYDQKTMTAERYIEWLKAGNASEHNHEAHMGRWLKESDPKWLDPISAITRGNADAGLPNVLCVTPTWCPDWHRFDDQIDWVTDTYLQPPERQQTSRVDVLPHGIYPYSGSYMDARTGKRVSSEIMTWIRLMSQLRDNPEEAAKIDDYSLFDEFAREGGFESHADAEANCAPLVPEEIRDLTEFAQLFAQAGVWRQLRPMLYTYWG